jgi:transcriptional regulator with XRE-family HTH domain
MLKEARQRAGLTQAQLAEKTGLPLASIRNWEQGHRTPRLGVVLTLARAVGVPVEELLVSLAQGLAPRPKKRPRRRTPRPRGGGPAGTPAGE